MPPPIDAHSGPLHDPNMPDDDFAERLADPRVAAEAMVLDVPHPRAARSR
jgi:hypothetical protein